MIKILKIIFFGATQCRKKLVRYFDYAIPGEKKERVDTVKGH